MGVMPPKDENTDQLQFFGMQTDIKYEDMLNGMLELTGKTQEFN